MSDREAAYQERTQMWFGEFRETFQTQRMRAEAKARKLARVDRKRFRYRNFDDLQFMCLKSRLATAIWRRRIDWQLEDCARWLVRCGLTSDQAQAVTDDVIRRRIRANRESGGYEIIQPPRRKKPKKEEEPRW